MSACTSGTFLPLSLTLSVSLSFRLSPSLPPSFLSLSLPLPPYLSLPLSLSFLSSRPKSMNTKEEALSRKEVYMIAVQMREMACMCISLSLSCSVSLFPALSLSFPHSYYCERRQRTIGSFDREECNKLVCVCVCVCVCAIERNETNTIHVY